MSEWDEFYEVDQKDESYEPLQWQVCDCETCKGETTEEGRKVCKAIRDKYLKKQRGND